MRKLRAYVFEANVVSKVEGYVWAFDEDDARELIQHKQWKELTDENIEFVDEIIEIELDEDTDYDY